MSARNPNPVAAWAATARAVALANGPLRRRVGCVAARWPGCACPPAALFLSVALLLGGCLRFEEKIVIQRDGSGLIELHYAVEEAVLPAMAEIQGLIQAWQGAPPEGHKVHELAWFMNEKLARKHFNSPGILLEHAAAVSRDGYRHVFIGCSVKDVRQALADGRFGDFTLRRNEAGDFVFRADLAEPPVPEAVSAARLEQLRGVCRGVKLRLEVQVPGPILATTATTQEGQRAVWEFDGEDLASSAVLARPPRIELTFSGEDLGWE